MKVEFVTADVFTNEPFGGNPVAVIPDATGVSSEAMQLIANEFNLSETTFVLPPQDPAHTAEVRIFTPKAEIPFAGHPNIGTAFVLTGLGQCHGKPVSDHFAFEEMAGLVEIELLRKNESVSGACLTAPQPFRQGEEISTEVFAAACSLSAGDIETANHSPCIASAGMAFGFAELKSRAALSASLPATEVFNKHFPAEAVSGLLLYVKSETSGIDYDVRVYAPLHGVYEDPATGSANVALAGLVASIRPEPDLDLSVSISQGEDMGRPSQLNAEAVKRNGEVETTRIGGNCVLMMRGTIDLD